MYLLCAGLYLTILWSSTLRKLIYLNSDTLSEKMYTTGTAARLLDVSFITIKRWIYSGKIKAEKNKGRWLIEEQEIERLRKELQNDRSNTLASRLIRIVYEKRVAFQRELQVCLEDDFLHKSTTEALKKLVSGSRLNTLSFGDYRWYYPKSISWNEVENLALEKIRLSLIYINHENRFERDGINYSDYSEYLVE